jgi:hypothetical protein
MKIKELRALLDDFERQYGSDEEILWSSFGDRELVNDLYENGFQVRDDEWSAIVSDFSGDWEYWSECCRAMLEEAGLMCANCDLPSYDLRLNPDGDKVCAKCHPEEEEIVY